MIVLSYTPSVRECDMKSILLSYTISEASIYLSRPCDTVLLVLEPDQTLQDSIVFLLQKTLPNFLYIDKELVDNHGTFKAFLLNKKLHNSLSKTYSSDVLFSSIPDCNLSKTCEEIGIKYAYSNKAYNYYNMINNKIEQYRLFNKFNLPFPEVYSMLPSTDVDVFLQSSLSCSDDKFIIKDAISSGGHGISLMIKKDDNSKIVFNKKSPTIFEKYYKINKEYNIQYFIDEKQIKFLGASYQLISKSKNCVSYLGNYYTKSSFLLKFKNYMPSIDHLLEETRSFGFYGVIGIDAFETKRGELIFSEINPRVNGSTYYLPVIKKIEANNITRSFLTIPFKITYLQMYDLLEKQGINLIENMKKGKNNGIFILDSSGFSVSDRLSSFSYLICGNSSDEIFRIYSIFAFITNCDKHCKEVASIIELTDRKVL